MAETELKIKSDGLDEIIAKFEKAITKGDELASVAEKIGDAQSAGAQQAVKAQEAYNEGLRTTGKELKAIANIDALGQLSSDADQQLRQVAKSLVEMGKKLVSVGPDGRKAFGEIIKMLVNLDDVLKEGMKLQDKYLSGIRETATGSADLIAAGLESTKASFEKNSGEISALVQDISSSLFSEGLPEGGLPILQSVLQLKEELAALEAKSQALDVIGEEFDKQRASVEGNAQALERLNEGEKQLAGLRAENAQAIDQNAAKQDELIQSLEALFDAEEAASQASLQASEKSSELDAQRLATTEALANAQQKQASEAEAASQSVQALAQAEAASAQQREASAEAAAGSEKARNGLIQDTIQSIKQLDGAVKSAKTEQELGKANAELAEAKASLKDLKKIGMPDLEPSTEQAKSLRTQIAQATAEVARLADEFNGQITPELVAAAEHAAELRSELADVNAVIGALDPSAKFQVFADLTQSVIGGFTAVSGVLSLVGQDGDKATETVAKMQGLLATLQGANAFLDGFGKGLKALNAFVIANTGATTANTAAKGANAAASGVLATSNTAAAGATGALTSGVRTLTAAMAANPIIAALVVLAAIATALVALGDDARDSAEGAGELVAKLQEIETLHNRAFSNNRRRQDLQDELRLLDEGVSAEGERLLAEDKYRNKQAEINAQIIDLFKNEQVLRQRIRDLSGATNEEEIKALETYEKALRESQEKRQQLNEDSVANKLAFEIQGKREQEELEQKAFAEAERRSKEAIARARAEAAALLKAQQDYANGVLALSEKLAADLRGEKITILQEQATKAEEQGQIEQARAFKDEIVSIREEQANELIEQSKRDLERKLAFIELEKTMTVDALKELSDEQRNALADGLIDSGRVQLAESEVNKFNALVNLAAAQAQRERTKNAADEVAARIEIEQKETAEAIKSIDAFEAYSVAAAENEVGTEQDKQRRILEIQIEAAKKKIAILESSGDVLDATEAEKLRTSLAGFEKELNGLKKFSLKNLFKLSDADIQILGDAFNQVTGAIQEGFFAQIEAQKAANEEYISGLDERLAATREALDREAGFKEAGLANNYERERQNEEQLLDLKEAAAKENERLAKKEQTAQRVVQLANLGATIAKLLSSEASKGVIGIGIAAAAIPVLFSLFGKAKAQAQGAAFFKGTPWLELGTNRPGRDTIPVMAHHGERIIPTKDNEQHWDLYEGVRTGNVEQLERGIRQVADHYGLEALRDAFAPTSKLPDLDLEFPSRFQGQREATEELRREIAFDPVMRGFLASMDGTMRTMLADALSKVDRVAIPGGYMEFQPDGGKRRVTLTKP